MGSQIQTKVKQLRDILLGVTEDVYHYEAKERPDKYVVYAEDGGGNDFASDNQKTGQAIQGSIDYFTKEEFDPTVDAIQDALDKAQISYYLNSVQYEDETEFIHWEWVFEIG